VGFILDLDLDGKFPSPSDGLARRGIPDREPPCFSLVNATTRPHFGRPRTNGTLAKKIRLLVAGVRGDVLALAEANKNQGDPDYGP
jgi:hypothetical protein